MTFIVLGALVGLCMQCRGCSGLAVEEKKCAPLTSMWSFSLRILASLWRWFIGVVLVHPVIVRSAAF